MTPDQIADERRRGRLAAGAAVAAAMCFVASALWSQVLSGDTPVGNRPAQLRYFDRHISDLVGYSALSAIGFLLLLAVTLHLWRAMKARRPEEPRVVFVVGTYGPLAAGIGSFAVGVALAIGASNFVDREFQTIGAADDAIDTVKLVGLLSFSGSLALAFWFVKGCLDAMRIGLLSRFAGVVGIALGPVLVLAWNFAQFLLPVWLLAIAAAFTGLGVGQPPAWEAGEAVSLPSARERLGGALEDTVPTTPNGEVEAVGPGVRKPERGAEGPQRRKRKRRGAA
jgi:hypothetical protein